jgi:hypothetical protein
MRNHVPDVMALLHSGRSVHEYRIRLLAREEPRRPTHGRGAFNQTGDIESHDGGWRRRPWLCCVYIEMTSCV